MLHLHTQVAFAGVTDIAFVEEQALQRISLSLRLSEQLFAQAHELMRRCDPAKLLNNLNGDRPTCYNLNGKFPLAICGR